MGANCSTHSCGPPKYIEPEDEPKPDLSDSVSTVFRRVGTPVSYVQTLKLLTFSNSNGDEHAFADDISTGSGEAPSERASIAQESIQSDTVSYDDVKSVDDLASVVSEADTVSTCPSRMMSKVSTVVSEADTVSTCPSRMMSKVSTLEPDDGQPSTRRKNASFVHDALPKFAKENPDAVGNVYSFAKGVLGSGNFGTVRKAKVKATGATRAISSIPKSKPPEEIAELRAQMEITSKFDHPNIVSLHEVFEDKGFVHLVMDYCPGGTLEQHLKNRAVSEVKTVIVIEQVLKGVYYLHKHDVCHRDLQPGKVMFVNVAKEITSLSSVKVSGFATSRKMKKRDRLSDIVGRPGYMAPEMCNGSYGRECDMWSLGIVLFQMLCGRLPFPCEPAVAGSGLRDLQVSSDESTRQPSKDQIPFSAQDENVSNTAQDLVNLLLKVSPNARLTAKQALNHQFLRKAKRKLASVPFNASTLVQLKTFRQQSVFLQTAFRIMAGHLGDREASNSRKLFLLLDRDGDGRIPPSELSKAIAKDPQIAAAFPHISEIFQNSDDADSGPKVPFTYTEFVAATFDREQCLTEGACRVAFRTLDKKGNGWISLSEFAPDIASGGTATEQVMMAANGDTQEDRRIDFKEFMDMMKTCGHSASK